MKILLIEDDRELAESMRFQLEKEGYETDICDDGEEGLYYMKERSHDLVILDGCSRPWMASLFCRKPERIMFPHR